MICDPDNLRLAFVKAKRGKQHKPGVYQYEKKLNENLRNLREQLLLGDLNIGDYNFFTVFEPKERLICAAPFHERVLHHSIINICHPVFERFQVFHSYATRIGKGQYAALEYAAKNQKKHQWFCKLDIRKYFDSIPHGKLIQLLESRFKEKKLTDIFEKIIFSYSCSDGKGLPIGNLTSQYFANYYLATADHYLLEKIQIPAYARYMDDMVLWHDDKRVLIEKIRKFVSFIEKHLELYVKQKGLNRTSKGLPFLGYVVFPYKRRLTKQSKQRFMKKFVQYDKMLQKGIWSQEEYSGHIIPLLAFIKYANTKKLRIEHIKKTETVHRDLSA